MVEGHYKAVTKALKSAGFAVAPGGKGSHEKWRGEDGQILIVPRKLMSRHTANAILKDAGVTLRV